MSNNLSLFEFVKYFKNTSLSVFVLITIFSNHAHGQNLIPGQYYDQAVQKMRQRDNQGVIEDCTRFIDSTPSGGLLFKDRRQTCFSYRGLAKERQGKYKEAVEDYTKALDLDPQDAFSWAHRGVANMRIINRKEAIDDLSKALQIEPNNHFYLAWRADARAYRNADNVGAIEDYTEAIKNVTKDEYFDQNSSDYYQKRAHVRINISDFDGANGDFEYIRKFFPKHSRYADIGLAEVVINKAVNAQKNPSSPYRRTSLSDERREVIQTGLAPFNSVVFIERMKPNGVVSKCTGTLVLSPLVVATAAHCINKNDDNIKLSNPIYISSKDGSGKVVDKVEAKVVAIGSDSKYDETSADFYDQLSVIVKENENRFGGLNGLSRPNQVDLFYINDWAVLVLNRKLNNTQEISLINESLTQLNNLPGKSEPFISIGFPGDWPGSKMIVTKCPTRPDNYTKWFNLFSDKTNESQYVALNFSRNEGCISYSGHSGGPLILYDYNLKKYIYAGVLSSSHGNQAEEVKRNEKWSEISEIRQKQERITDTMGDRKYYDGALGAIGTSFIISTDFIRAMKEGALKGRPKIR